MTDLVRPGTLEAEPSGGATEPAVLSEHRLGAAAALGLACLYLAVMSGHLSSIDGLVMWRQALSLAFHHSLQLSPSFWWGGEIVNSSRGIGASLQYVPGALAMP